MSEIPFEDKQFGFVYGAAEITRIHSDEKTGKVFIDLKTKKRTIQIHITKTGIIRLFDPGWIGKCKELCVIPDNF